MQEEALKKHDEKTEVKPEPSSETVAVKPKRVKRRITKVQRAEPHAPEARVVPLVLRPVVRQPNTYDALANLHPLPAAVFSLDVYRTQVIISKVKSRKRARRRAAAFLLLAA